MSDFTMVSQSMECLLSRLGYKHIKVRPDRQFTSFAKPFNHSSDLIFRCAGINQNVQRAIGWQKYHFAGLYSLLDIYQIKNRPHDIFIAFALPHNPGDVHLISYENFMTQTRSTHLSKDFSLEKFFEQMNPEVRVQNELEVRSMFKPTKVKDIKAQAPQL